MSQHTLFGPPDKRYITTITPDPYPLGTTMIYMDCAGDEEAKAEARQEIAEWRTCEPHMKATYSVCEERVGEDDREVYRSNVP